MTKTITAKEVLDMYEACASVGTYKSRTFQTEVIINRERLKDYVVAIEAGKNPSKEFQDYTKAVRAITDEQERLKFVQDNADIINARSRQLSDFENSLADMITINPYPITRFPEGEGNVLPFRIISALQPAIPDENVTDTQVVVPTEKIYRLFILFSPLGSIVDTVFSAALSPVVARLKEKHREILATPTFATYRQFINEQRYLGLYHATRDSFGMPKVDRGSIIPKRPEDFDADHEKLTTHYASAIEKWSELLSENTTLYVRSIKECEVPESINGDQLEIIYPFMARSWQGEDS